MMTQEKEATPAAAKEETPICAPGMRWFVLRVASNKEDKVRAALERKVTIEGLEDHVGRILVPTVKERRMRGGQVKVSERKLYPGYVFVEMGTESDGSVHEGVWFMTKEATGAGDFIASDGKPIPMSEKDAANVLAACQKSEEAPGLSGMDLKKGELVKITEGSFESYEGEVESVDQRRGMVTVVLEVFGRATPVEVEYWQLEKLD